MGVGDGGFGDGVLRSGVCSFRAAADAARALPDASTADDLVDRRLWSPYRGEVARARGKHLRQNVLNDAGRGGALEEAGGACDAARAKYRAPGLWEAESD